MIVRLVPDFIRTVEVREAPFRAIIREGQLSRLGPPGV
jgi:hypothetical protein